MGPKSMTQDVQERRDAAVASFAQMGAERLLVNIANDQHWYLGVKYPKGIQVSVDPRSIAISAMLEAEERDDGTSAADIYTSTDFISNLDRGIVYVKPDKEHEYGFPLPNLILGLAPFRKKGRFAPYTPRFSKEDRERKEWIELGVDALLMVDTLAYMEAVQYLTPLRARQIDATFRRHALDEPEFDFPLFHRPQAYAHVVQNVHSILPRRRDNPKRPFYERLSAIGASIRAA